PFVADINNDGILDLSGASADIGGSQAYFYLWNTNEQVNEELMILPVLQYNVRHDGVYVDAAILNANFIASPIELCEQEETQFTDQSTGDVVSWEWTFVGGNPTSSTEQNPSVVYASPGEYDVSLTVSDGSNSHTISKTDYIKVATDPVIPDQPVGPTEVLTSQNTYTIYETTSSNADNYVWQLVPDDMGVIVAGDTITKVKVYWSQSNSYSVELSVKAENVCGESEFSEPLTIYVNWNTDISNQEEDIFEIFPNPNNGVVFIDLKKMSGDLELTILNTVGKKLKTETFTNRKDNIVNVDLSDFPDGVYFCVLKIGELIQISKLIIL
ncbi:MAG: PKD domain-containing protein, partial [Bacteroidales bacterium]|nr:PKD domain-containing protein [Bacteroidales bacterium]